MDKKNLFALSKTKDIVKILEPLTKNTAVNFFHYFKTYENGKIVTFTNNGSWLEHYFESKYYEISSFREKPTKNYDKYQLTSDFKTSKPIVEDALNHNIGPGIVLINSHKSFCEYFLFCNDPKYGNSNQFFLNNLEILNKFIYYFKDKSHSILKEAEQYKLQFPKSCIVKPNDIPAMQINNLSFDVKRYYIDDKNYLTQKEYECIYWLAKGKSCHEISQILATSRRTIETHTENAKKKFGVSKTLSAILLAKELRFI